MVHSAAAVFSLKPEVSVVLHVAAAALSVQCGILEPLATYDGTKRS
jgi:hypothetical protein